MSGVGKFRSEMIDVDFSVEMEQQDYGVPGSPVWWEPIWDSLEVDTLTVLGVDVAIDSLPQELRQAILDLADEVEWETDDDL
jgi:hypothetical protein